MELLKLRPGGEPLPCVVSIGNFDGVHLGHQKMLKQLSSKAKQLQLPSVVIVFEPQPKEWFVKQVAPARLTNFRQKWLKFKKLGIDKVLCLRFNQSLANLSATDFIRHCLSDFLDVRYLLVGEDFQFGAKRQGNVDTLKTVLAKRCQVDVFKTVLHDKVRISSTTIRQALAAGQVNRANTLLGAPFQLSGRVAHGDKRGRTIGVPTANIYIKSERPALRGVFLVWVDGLSDKSLPAVANIGFRPTVSGQDCVLEVHILAFEQMIYQQRISVRFIKKLRDEKKFADFNALKNQIEQDLIAAKQYFMDHEVKTL